MIITKKNRLTVYAYLFKEGVLVAKKDVINKHPRIEGDIPNVEVLALMKSFKSRELVNHTYNWRYNYYYLNEEGIKYLREYLHIPEGIIPKTYQKPTKKLQNSRYNRKGRNGNYDDRRGGNFKRGSNRGGKRGGKRGGNHGGNRGGKRGGNYGGYRRGGKTKDKSKVV
jgi:small subunit ribosomal protein S10e